MYYGLALNSYKYLLWSIGYVYKADKDVKSDYLEMV